MKIWQNKKYQFKFFTKNQRNNLKLTYTMKLDAGVTTNWGRSLLFAVLESVLASGGLDDLNLVGLGVVGVTATVSQTFWHDFPEK